MDHHWIYLFSDRRCIFRSFRCDAPDLVALGSFESKGLKIVSRPKTISSTHSIERASCPCPIDH